MANPHIHGNRAVYSASTALEAAGRALAEIKSQDRLTWSDVGAVLGVSEDQAAKYADGTSTMSFVTFGRGKKEWNGRFTGYFDRLCEDSRPGKVDDRHGHTTILQAALALSVALEDGDISPEEVRANRHTLENARDAIEAQLAKLVLRA
jgi:hypothetical protein